jgi:hypothetical protein
MINNYKILANRWAFYALPMPFWIVLGLLQVVFSLGLVLPGITQMWRKVPFISAVSLAVISVFGTVLYVSYSGFPGVLWGVVPALLLAFVAYKRGR